MRVLFLAAVFCALSCLDAARADDADLHLAFQQCGQARDLKACDILVARPDLDTQQRATAYAARGWVRYVLTDLAGARADLMKAQALDAHNDEVEILRDRLSDVDNDPYKKWFFHCRNRNETDAQKRIQSCTQLIGLKTPKRESLGQDYELRAHAYIDAGDFADARADLLKAQQLDPVLPGYQADYVIASYASGDYQAALGAAEKAIAGAPYPSGRLLLMRGQLDYLTNQYDKAAEDYRTSLRFNPQDLESIFWLDLMRLEQHQDVTADLQHLLASLNPANLATATVRFQLGLMTPDAFMAIANQGVTDERPERLCIAYFNLGHKAWLTGDTAGARHDFQQALQTNRYILMEYQASKVLLHRLG